jgi:hypothetical protein
MTRRIVLLCVLLTLGPVLAPAGASAQQFGVRQQTYEIPPSMVGRHNGECKRLTRMISVYADKADMARARGNEAWEEGSLNQIARLSERRARLCPTLYAEKPIGEELSKILKGAAKIALKLFTMGLI